MAGGKELPKPSGDSARADDGARDEASHGITAFPVPPAVEFPYPQRPHSSTDLAAKDQDDETRNSAADLVTTPGLLEQVKALPSRPGPAQRSVTAEHAPTTQPEPHLPLRRGNTTTAPRATEPSSWDSDFDSSTSESGRRLPARPPRAPTRWLTSAARQPENAVDTYRRFAVNGDKYATKGKVSKKDGRLNISLHETSGKGYLAKTLEATLRHHMPNRIPPDDETRNRALKARPALVHAGTGSTLDSINSTASAPYEPVEIPPMNIVIMVIGSRGDIQPFIRIGKILKEKHGHRVRIATHPAFREFIEKDSQLEFFSVGGDPAELMAFMVKNPGLIPKAKTIREGEIAKRREAMFEMFQGFWRACINATDDEHDVANLKMMGNKAPFVADAIIANPPSFAHVHCAERLGVPLHLMFTFATTPTQRFPHPLANIKQTNVDANYTNFISYPLVEMMTWQGLGDLINRFRVKDLGLEPVSTLWAPGRLFRMRVPYSYMWSPALIPKPEDWGPEIDITGFVFLDLASSFKPHQRLLDFLEDGEPPVYIGFGSIVVDDPESFTELIFDAVKKAGVRALVSKGWGGLGDEDNVPENIYMLGNTPHDWLFPRVSAVVHHGGAGSTAIALKTGRPTCIVPFFGDQSFWGAMVHKAGAGPAPIPYKHLTSDLLADAIKELFSTDCQKAATRLAEQIASDGDGADNAVNAFHRALPLRGNHSMRCSILEDRVAVWWVKGTHVRLSALAAEILAQRRQLSWAHLRLVRHYDWNDFEGPGEPLTGAGGAMIRDVAAAAKGVGGTPSRWATTIRQSRTSTSFDHARDKKKNNVEKANPDPEGTDRQPPLARHDEQSGSMTRGPLPPANLGEGRLKKEMSKSESSQKGNLGPICSDLADKDGHQQPTATGSFSAEDNAHVAASLAAGTGAGVLKTGKALVRSPVDISVALAQGFHNAPRLWGDDTVRTPRRVTGMKSALRAAGEEFAFGIHDGVRDLLWQPYHGAKQEGALGFAKGLGKGIGGFILKDLAAITGVPAYTLRGIQKEIGKGSGPTNIIRRAHILEGQRELTHLSKDDLQTVRQEVTNGWRIILAALENKSAMEHNGISGRLFLRKTRKKWKKHGVFENVEQIDQALDAEEKGRDFNEVFKRHRRELHKAEKMQSPRKNVGGVDGAAATSVSNPSSGLSPKRRLENNHAPSTSIDGRLAEGQSVQKEEPEAALVKPATADRHPNVASTDFEPTSFVGDASPSSAKGPGDAAKEQQHDRVESKAAPSDGVDVPKPATDGQMTETPAKRDVLRQVLSA